MPSPRSLTAALRLEHQNRQWAKGAGVVYRIPPHLWKRRGDIEKDAAGTVAHKTVVSAFDGKNEVEWKRLDWKGSRMRKVNTGDEKDLLVKKVPTLKHGLERVLKEGGVHRMAGQGHRSRSVRRGGSRRQPKEFGQWVGSIPEVEKVDWERFPKYVPAGKDEKLRKLGERLKNDGVQFVGSTSSMTSIIAAMYHLVSNFKDTGLLGGLGVAVSQLPKTFVKSYARPTSVILRRKEGSTVTTVDSHTGLDKSPSILRDLGHPLERLLTMTPDEFVRSCILEDGKEDEASDGISFEGQEGKADVEQYYNYSKAGKFLMRAQIDCRDDVGKRVFDLKSRAVAAIRYDLDSFKENAHVKIQRICGVNGSYEREFYDMVRGAFLKYVLQLRIGRMSGAFFTYHNTTEVLGFEYVDLKEMECYVFGSTRWAEIAVGASTELLGTVFSEISQAFLEDGSSTKESHIKVVVDSERSAKEMTIYAQRFVEEDPVHPKVFETAMPNEMARKPKKSRYKLRLPPSRGHGSKDPRRAAMMNANDDIERDAQEKALDDGVAAVGIPGIDDLETSFDVGKALERTIETLNLCTKSGLPLQWVEEPLVAEKNLRVWKLRLQQKVNGVSTKSAIAYQDKDHFSLQYSLERIPVRKKECIGYMRVLKRLYAAL